ncbi:MAG: hypothetical protein IJ137_05555 [Eubacterium sp.]|nr:hypothetical protein [Eubacterium sp.]
MQNRFRNRIENLISVIENNRVGFYTVLTVMILFTVVITLSLPGITLTRTEPVLECQYKVHEHTKECYQEIYDEHGQKRKTLVCGYADYVVHTHDDNCFDKDGQLVCQLPEVRKHTHDEDCYREEKVLTCGEKEGEDHKHSDSCYETVRVLRCQELELHTHNKKCYDKEGNLTCGKLQLEVHQHGKDCLVEKEVEDEEAETLTMDQITADAVDTGRQNEDDATEEKQDLTVSDHEENVSGKDDDSDSKDASGQEASDDESSDEEKAADGRKSSDNDKSSDDRNSSDEEKAADVGNSSDESESSDKDNSSGDENQREIYYLFDDSTEESAAKDETDAEKTRETITFEESTDRVTVHVSTDLSAFPEGTTMVVRDVDDQKIIDTVAEAVNGRVKQVQAVDITFLDAEGREVEPAAPIRVTMSSDIIAEVEAPQVVHVDDAGTAEIVELADLADGADAAAGKESAAGEDSVFFEAERFSVYAIVTTEELPSASAVSQLDGKSYGIINNQNTVSGTALGTSASNSNTRLSGKTLTVRTEPVKRTENVFVAENSEITMWSFRSVSGDQYHITAEVGGALKFLRIDGSTVTLVDEPDDNCVITVEAGTGIYSGKYKFSSNGSALRLNGTTFDRAADLTNSNNANCWMNLAELSNLKDDDFVVYTAEKVSVSGTVKEDGSIDYDVEDGDQVIIYTRIWNEDTLRYDYYAIDYDGMLVKAYESGDTISWVGSKVNTMLWDFTEYHYLDEYGNDTGVPSYYYELQNAYSGKYIAPQVSETGFLSDSTIGINLNGRRNGEYYTTVLAWDDPYYDYASLKARDWKLTSAPISKADTFYFAVMKPDQTEEQLTTVATIDSEPFGITLKMQNYANVGSNNRSQTQTNVLQDLTYNQWSGVKNLLSKYIADGESYPTSTKTGQSLADLYSEALTVNNQFLLSTYKETGYFEYDSTQNFAHLISSDSDPWYGKESPSGGTYGIGDFVIYDQIASTTESTGDTRRHGQFFPYNDLTEGSFISNMVNDTDIHGAALSSLDPRKGEKLYKLQYKNAANTDPRYVDFFFGMEMDASFMQSASGLDAWGHDLIFEFSGDDDFWLYIDGVLVLDLGGIHSALDGSVNFRTGKVIENGKESTLRERFGTAYKAQYPDKTQDEVNEWLNGIFKDGGTVFNDYSGHTMKMFYQERGAGASNLHMRFNLAPYKDGQVLLEKEVSGTDAVDRDAAFPFRIQYREKDWPEDRYESVTESAGTTGTTDPGDSAEPNDTMEITSSVSVRDYQTGDPVTFRESYEVNGVTYENVYLLKAGQTIAIDLLDEDTEYFITECGMNSAIYDQVKANEDILTGTDTSVPGVKDYKIESSTVAARKKVIYDNHVSETAMHNLTITKKLWEDVEKTGQITDDNTEFRFRIYIGKDGDNYTVYNTGKYYVKDPEGNYCIYSNGSFNSTGINDFSQLSQTVSEGEWKSQQEQATFHTSPGGIADKIPAGYSVEVPGLMDGMAFYVLERADEIPSGYNLIDYEREGSVVPEGQSANEGLIEGKDEGVIINNQHGYGLTASKVWSDADFMEDHDEIYFAVYQKDADDRLTLLEGSVRQLSKTGTSINWFFKELDDGKNLNDYVVYEVTLTDGKYSADPATGLVTLASDCQVTRINENETLTVGGNTNEHGYSANFVYTANYSRHFLTAEQLSENVNSRTDTVTNSRPGIKLLKTDLAGNPLSGAAFTLVKKNDQTTKKNFLSDENGLIAVAYLTANEEYTLTETAAPYKYRSLIGSLTIKVDSDGKLLVNGSETPESNAYYTITQVENPTADNMPTVTIQNKPITLRARKIDAGNDKPISNIHFELYREVEDYNHQPMPDYNPMEGFEDLVTDSEGLIPKISLEDLNAGTYYLREKQTTTQYVKLDYDIRFTISKTGQVTVEKAVYSTSQKNWVFSNVSDGEAQVKTDDSGNITLLVKNTPAKGVQILKKNYDNIVLAEAEFALYKMDQVSDGQPKEGEQPLLTGITGEDGIMNLGALDVNSTYYLFETRAPEGYNPLTEPVIINTLSRGSLKATLNGEPLQNETIHDGITDIDLVQIAVYNSMGYELPSTGGPGTKLYYLLGGILLIFAAGSLWRRLSSFIRVK